LINPMAPVIGPTAASASGIALASPPANVDQAGGERPLLAHASRTPGRPGTGADLERELDKIVNPALVNPPRAMALKLSHSASPALDEFDDLPPDFDDSDLDEAMPVRPVSARSTIASSSAKSHPHQVRQGPMAKESGKKVRLQAMRSPPPPPPQKKRRVLALRNPPPPPAERTVTLRVRRRPAPPPAERTVTLRARHSPPPPTSGNKVTFPVRRSALPPTAPSGHPDK